MTINKLASEIARREGKKSQARIGDIREILSILSDMFYANYSEHGVDLQKVIDATGYLDSCLIKNGAKRAKAKAKKARGK